MTSYTELCTDEECNNTLMENEISNLHLEMRLLKLQVEALQQENKQLKESIGCMAINETAPIKKQARSFHPLVKARMNFYHAKKAVFKPEVEAKYGLDCAPWQLVKEATNQAFGKLTKEEQMSYF